MKRLHVRTPVTVIEKNTHISHLHRFVSAYETSTVKVVELVQDLQEAIIKAKKEKQGVMVDQDGEMFFMVNPNGTFDLCIRWKSYEFVPEREL